MFENYPCSVYSISALIFNPYTLKIYDIGDTSMTYEEGPFAVACPATNKEEEDFNKRFSLDHKSLFVQYYSSSSNDRIYKIRCKSSVELAVAYYNEPGTKLKYLTFGYEVSTYHHLFYYIHIIITQLF